MVATRNSAVVGLDGGTGNAGYVSLTEAEFNDLLMDDLLEPGTTYYLTDTGLANLAIGINDFVTLNSPVVPSSMMPYHVLEDEEFRIEVRKQALIAMPTRIDGIVINDGIIVEVV